MRIAYVRHGGKTNLFLLQDPILVLDVLPLPILYS